MKFNPIFTIKFLSMIGILLAIFLLFEQFTKPSTTICYLNSTVNCDAIISGPVANTLGIPTPLFGLLGYSIIYLSAVLKKKRLILYMATFGLLFCGYIAYIELIQLKVICPICIVCQIIMLTVYSLSLYINLEKTKSTELL